MILNWFSPVWGHHDGYGNAAEQIIRALEKRGNTVGITHQELLVYRGPCDRAWIAAHPKQEARCGVYFTLPTTWMAAYRHNIGFSMYESSELPREWLPWLRKVQEIWVPSTYCAEIFGKYTSRPIHVIPLGVNPELFPIRRKPRAGRARFLHMASAHQLTRKGADLAVAAFLKAFPAESAAELIVQAPAGESPAARDPRIVYTKTDIPLESLAEYFGDFDALLYTSRGEGFGLLALEAAATGLPIFHSGETGMRDYSDIGVVVPAREVPAATQEGTWFEIQTSPLAAEIKKLFESPAAYAEKALRDAQRVHLNFSWDATARRIEQRLASKSANRLFDFLKR